MFQCNSNRFVGRHGTDPTAHIVTIRLIRCSGSHLYIIGGLFHIVDQHFEIGRLKIAPRQSRLHQARLGGNHIGEIEVKAFGRGEVHLVTIVGTAHAMQVVLVVLVHLIVQETVDRRVGVSRRGGTLADALALSQAQDEEGIGIIVIGVLAVDVSRGVGLRRPDHGAATIEKDIVAIVEFAVSLARHIDGHLHQIVGTRNGVLLRQHPTAIMIDTDLARVDVGHIDTQLRKVGSSEFVDPRFGQSNLIPIARGHCRAGSKAWGVSLCAKIGGKRHRKRRRDQLFILVAPLTERHNAHREQRLIARAQRHGINHEIWAIGIVMRHLHLFFGQRQSFHIETIGTHFHCIVEDGKRLAINRHHALIVAILQVQY